MCGERAGWFWMNVHPHPGPLPQERERRSPVALKFERNVFAGVRGTNGNDARTTQQSLRFKGRTESFSLSPGERAGVRASVTSNFNSSPEFVRVAVVLLLAATLTTRSAEESPP